MDPEWARDIRDQCVDAGVPFFFKQWGAHDAEGRRVGKKQAGAATRAQSIRTPIDQGAGSQLI